MVRYTLILWRVYSIDDTAIVLGVPIVSVCSRLSVCVCVVLISIYSAKVHDYNK